MEKYYKIGYGCGCGEVIEFITADTYDEAEREAYTRAQENYESYAGLHGVLSYTQLAEEMFGDPNSGDDYDVDTLSEEALEELNDAYFQEIENTIDYWAEEISKEQYEKEKDEC